MATLIVYANQMGSIASALNTYNGARTGNSSTKTAYNGQYQNFVGQDNNGSQYICHEGFIEWSGTSALGASATVTAVALHYWCTSWAVAVAHTQEFRLRDWGGSDVDTADWVSGASLPTPIVASITCATTPPTGSGSEYLPATDVAFVANINKTAATRVLINSSRHRLNNSPGVFSTEGLFYSGAENPAGTGTEARLTITYTPALIVKTGTVVATGGGVITQTGKKGALRSQAMTGGGVATITAPSKGARRAVAATGGGVIAATGRKAASGSSATGYFAAVMGTPGLVGYWRLGEASGNPQDSFGTNHFAKGLAGTVTRGVAGAIADGDTAINFNGGTFGAAHGAALALGDGPFSIELWVKRTTFGVIEMTVTKGSQFELHTEAGNNFALGNATVSHYRSTGTISDTNWHHVVVTRLNNGAGNTKFYIDGVEGSSSSGSGVMSANAADLVIGGRTYLSYAWHGSLDEFALYNVVLSAATVLDHYNAAVPVTTGVRATGGGVVTITGVKGDIVVAKYGTVAATGGGVITSTSVKGASAALPMTGGGVVSLARTTARSRTITMTGGGAAALQRTTARSYALTAKGGGVIVVAYSVTAAVAKTGVASLTGGGVIVVGARKAALRTLTMTGGGVITSTSAAGRKAQITATGGGVIVVARVAGRRAGVVATGGGAITLARRTARSGTATATGGGRITYAYAAGSSRSGFISATGGGVITITGTASWPRLKRSYSVLI